MKNSGHFYCAFGNRKTDFLFVIAAMVSNIKKNYLQVFPEVFALTFLKFWNYYNCIFHFSLCVSLFSLLH